MSLAQSLEKKLQAAAGAVAPGEMLNVDGYNMVSLEVTITNTATVTFEASGKGAVWTPIAALPVGSTDGVPATTATATGLFQVNVAGLVAIRARVSAWTSGTVTVFARASTAVFTR